MGGHPPPPPSGGPGGPRAGARVLLVLPCNPCVRLGDYMRCDNWRVVWPVVWDYYLSGLLDLAAVDSCKPGLVPWGGEGGLRWCDLHPSTVYRREPWRLPLLAEAVARDVVGMLRYYEAIAYYVNVKVYRRALGEAARRAPPGRVVDAGPPRPTVPSYRSTRSRLGLRMVLERLVSHAYISGPQ